MARVDCYQWTLNATLADVKASLFRPLFWLLVVSAIALFWSPLLWADDSQDLETGRKLFESAEWRKAIDFFETAIDGDHPTLKDPTLIPKARMYWAASAFNLGQKDDADKQFEAILRADPKFEPDAIVFSAGVLDEFHIVQDRIVRGDVHSQEIAKLQAELKVLAATKKKQDDEIKTLIPLAREEWVIEKRSRVLATLPFGVGQFQNGDTALGVVFLSTEAVALVAASISYVDIQLFISKENPIDGPRAALEARIINWISIGTFFGIAVGGIIQAHVAFVPETKVKRNRTLPDSIAFQPFVAPAQEGCVLGLAGTF